jgi:xylulokinase
MAEAPPPGEPALSLEDRLVLAIDLGTGGPKVGLVSMEGVVAWSEHIAVPTTFLDGGGAEQDPAHWWDVVTDAARRGLAAVGDARHNVVAIACTGQWASTVPVDESGVPVGPCLLWMDSRGGRYSRAVVGGPIVGYGPGALARFLRRTGGMPATSGADPLGHVLFIENERPEVAAAARWYLEPVDYLSMRFTGVAAASHASMIASWLTDNRDLDRLEYDKVLVAASTRPANRLPPLRATGSVVGSVLPAVALDLALPEGVKVVTGVPDLHTAATACGAVNDYEPHMTISTSSWVSCPVPFKKTDAIRQIASVPGLSPSSYLVVNNHETAGACLQWLRDNVFGGDGGGGAALDYDSLTALAAAAPPGSGDVIFAPWLTGERSPVDDRNARAGFHNLSMSTTRPHMVRALLEGVAYNQRWLYEAVERFVSRRLDPVRLIGGGAASDLWCQIHADVLDRKVERVAEPLVANLRGAALFAALSLGALQPAQLRDLVRVDATFVPDPANRKVYERLYAELPKLYKSQRPMFARLNRRSSSPA